MRACVLICWKPICCGRWSSSGAVQVHLSCLMFWGLLASLLSVICATGCFAVGLTSCRHDDGGAGGPADGVQGRQPCEFLEGPLCWPRTALQAKFARRPCFITGAGFSLQRWNSIQSIRGPCGIPPVTCLRYHASQVHVQLRADTRFDGSLAKQDGRRQTAAVLSPPCCSAVSGSAAASSIQACGTICRASQGGAVGKADGAADQRPQCTYGAVQWNAVSVNASQQQDHDSKQQGRHHAGQVQYLPPWHRMAGCMTYCSSCEGSCPAR